MPEDPLAYKDSMSRCDTYSNPFDFRSDPGFDIARRRAAEKRMEQAGDKLETEQQKIERHLIEQFMRSQYNLPDGKMHMMGQVGKLVFVIFTMPPYFLFYTFPKLVYQKALVPGFERLGDAGEAIKKILDKVGPKVEETLRSLGKNVVERLQAALQILQIPPIFLFKIAKQAVETVQEKLQLSKERGKQASEIVAAMQTFMKNMVMLPIQPMQQFAQNMYEKAKQAAIEIKKAVQAVILPPIQKAMEKTKVAYEAVSRVVKNVAEYSTGIAPFVQKNFEKIIEKSRPVIEGVKEVVTQLGEKIKETIVQYPTQYVEKIKEGFKYVAETSKTVVSYVQEKLHTGKDLIKEAFQNSVEVVKVPMQWMGVVVVPWMGAQIQSYSSNPIRVAQLIALGIVKGGKYIIAKARAKFTQLVNKLARFFEEGRKKAVIVWEFVKEKSKKLYAHYFSPIFRKLTLSNLIHFFRVLFAWIRVLFRLSKMILSDLFNEVFSLRR